MPYKAVMLLPAVWIVFRYTELCKLYEIPSLCASQACLRAEIRSELEVPHTWAVREQLPSSLLICPLSLIFSCSPHNRCRGNDRYTQNCHRVKVAILLVCPCAVLCRCSIQFVPFDRCTIYSTAGKWCRLMSNNKSYCVQLNAADPWAPLGCL